MEIPNLKVEEGNIVLDILEVPIRVNNENKIVKMKKASAGSRREVIKKYVKTGVLNQQMKGEVTDPMGIQIGILSNVIIEAPFDYSEKGLEKLPEDVLDYLYNQYQEWSKKKLIQD